MNDVYVEKLVKKKKDFSDTLLQVLIGLLAVSLIVYIVCITVQYSNYAFFLLLGAAAIGFGAWYLISIQNIEYELCLTNEYFDVDCIINQKKRKRMISTSCREFIEFGKYVPEAHRARTYQKRLYPCNRGEPRYYAVVNDGAKGRTLLVFAPSEEMLEGMKKFQPRQVARDAFAGD